MTSDAHPASGRLFVLLVVLAVGVAAVLVALVSADIVRAADAQPLQHADAIVVFGAAQYSGHPSPVYRARLDHAFDLYQQGWAPLVVTTGGAAADPDFSEGGVGQDYLAHRGVPEPNLIAETQGSDTSESARRVAAILHTNGVRSCIAVSDEYHVFRIGRLLAHEGLQVYLSPRPNSRPRHRLQRGIAVLREATSYLAWRMGIS